MGNDCFGKKEDPFAIEGEGNDSNGGGSKGKNNKDGPPVVKLLLLGILPSFFLLVIYMDVQVLVNLGKVRLRSR